MGDIVCSLENGILLITMTRDEKLNALNKSLREQMIVALRENAKRTDVRGLIITGNDKVFSAGVDIDEEGAISSEIDMERFLRHCHELMNEVERFPHPVIAAVRGWALGGGAELALACDFRIAGSSAVIGYPEIHLGMFPAGGGTQRLPRIVGIAKAKELILLGEKIDANEALRIGLVNKVVNDEQVLSEAADWARRLNQFSKEAICSAKSAINYAVSDNLQGGLEKEILLASSLAGTVGRNEGLVKFKQRK